MKKSCKSLKTWFNSEKEGCPPCSLSILIAWYRSELGDDKLKRLGLENSSPEEVIDILDRIKEENPDKKERLKELDCYVQDGNSMIG